MLQLVNEDLMSFAPTTYKDPKNHRLYYKLKILTSNRIIQPEGNLRRPKTDNRRNNRNVNQFINQTEKLVPVDREILRISIPGDDIQKLEKHNGNMTDINFDWNEKPMSINITDSGTYNAQIDIRCHNQGDDHANLYLIAFPFNGLIKPIEEDPKYRIYKGFISVSARPFFFNQKKYRKVLYLVVEVNKNLFKDDHKYHQDEIEISLESYALFDDKTTGEKKTDHEIMMVIVKSPDGQYSVRTSKETINHAVMMNSDGRQLWPIYTFNKNESTDYPRRNTTGNETKSRHQRNPNKNKVQKTVSREGDTLVTTNKHGIRKEIPTGSRNGDRNNYRSNYQNDNKDRSANAHGNRRPMNNRGGKPVIHTNNYRSRDQY